MDWTKIKTKHFLFSELSATSKGNLISLLCLTAHLEKMPSTKQMGKVCTNSALTLIQSYLEVEGSSLKKVLEKVLEDVKKIDHKKEVSRSTSKTYRETHKKDYVISDTSRDTSFDTTEKRREDKRREEHIEECFNSVWEKYPKKDGKKKAFSYYKGSVNTEKDKSDIEKALINYLNSDNVKRGYIKNGSTWFNNWEDWVNWKEPKKVGEIDKYADTK